MSTSTSVHSPPSSSPAPPTSSPLEAEPRPTLPPLLIRPASLLDAAALGRLATYTHRNSGLTAFLHPHISTYYADYENGAIQRVTGRLLDPRSLTYVACLVSAEGDGRTKAGDSGKVVGYVRFVRLGDDEFAKKRIGKWGLRWLILWVLGMLWGIWMKIYNLVHGDRSASPEASAEFMALAGLESKTHWDVKKFPERKNRWHGQSVCVDEKWQAKGIGRRLMEEIMRTAEEEGVVVGVEATRAGERLYRKLGFELLARFERDFEEGGGGYMLWLPEGMRGRKGEGGRS